jgi:Di-N-acetylchitobiase
MRLATALALIVVILLWHGEPAAAKSFFRRRSQQQRQISDQWVRNLRSESSAAPSCPCERLEWCQQINSTTPRSSREVYGFTGSPGTGLLYNWTYITTVAWASSDEVMCRAHQHGARALLAAPSFNLTEIVTAANPNEFIRTWVAKSLQMISLRFRDGIVFDMEDPWPKHSPQAHAYVKLIRMTRNAFRQHDPPLQVSTCVAWSPDNIDGRDYNYRALAEASDLLYVMDYDTQSQVTEGPCVANANAPFAGMKRGIDRYRDMGIDVAKLVLGVPWYGYRYPCLNGTAPDARYCPVPLVPFRGVNCSDAAGTEITYSDLISLYRAQTDQEANLTGGWRRDDYMNAAFFNTIENGTTMQYWFDDHVSIRDKFAWAAYMGLGGVGPYTFDYLDPIALPTESKQMWSTLDAFHPAHDADESS